MSVTFSIRNTKEEWVPDSDILRSFDEYQALFRASHTKEGIISLYNPNTFQVVLIEDMLETLLFRVCVEVTEQIAEGKDVTVFLTGRDAVVYFNVVDENVIIRGTEMAEDKWDKHLLIASLTDCAERYLVLIRKIQDKTVEDEAIDNKWTSAVKRLQALSSRNSSYNS